MMGGQPVDGEVVVWSDLGGVLKNDLVRSVVEVGVCVIRKLDRKPSMRSVGLAGDCGRGMRDMKLHVSCVHHGRLSVADYNHQTIHQHSPTYCCNTE